MKRTPFARDTTAPMVTIRTPLRPTIGLNAEHTLRLPVPLRWRRGQNPVRHNQTRAPAERLDIHHHWTGMLGIDWRITNETLHRTAFSPSLSAVKMGSAILRQANADIRVRRQTQSQPPWWFPGTVRQWSPASEPAAGMPPTERSVAHRAPRAAMQHAQAADLRAPRPWPRRISVTNAIIPDPDRRIVVTHAPANFVRTITTPASSLAARRQAEVVAQPRPSGRPSRMVTPAAPNLSRKTRAGAATHTDPPAAILPVSRVWRTSAGKPSLETQLPAPAAASGFAPSAQSITRFQPGIAAGSAAVSADMNRLVDEVMRRLDRQARAERQRRGV